MAILPSRLSYFISCCGAAEEILPQLRNEGLLSTEAGDDLVDQIVRKAFVEEAVARAEDSDDWASADTIIAGQLVAHSYLSNKGLAWFYDKDHVSSRFWTLRLFAWRLRRWFGMSR